MKKNSPIEIREVMTKQDLRRFVDYPNILYKDVEQFIPAFYADDLDDWDPKKNPAFAYCEAKRFLAYRDGEIVGRIRLRQEVAGKNWIVCDILANWSQDSIKKDDVVFAD